ncbi:MAG: DinB family protein [Bacteroidia bacterium]|nr:DinB family protein [Bacteroidia bacterium]
MNKAKSLANRTREVFLNGERVAFTNYKKLLSDVSFEQATSKVGDLNTIAALTFHVNYYVEGLVNVFKGGPLDIRDKYSFDMPPINSEEDWIQLRSALLKYGAEFADLVDQFSDEKLESPFIDEKYGNYSQNIEIIIEHSYYHLGQVSLIKKMTS